MKMSVSAEEMGDSLDLALCGEFFAAAQDFLVMQQAHEGALFAENYKDLLSWPQSRERAFRNLARIFAGMADCGLDKKGDGARICEVMREILDKEAVLQGLVMSRQLKIQEQLLAMRKGKEALQGYNINKGLVPRPRYLSNKM